jgi:hypothetical protein
MLSKSDASIDLSTISNKDPTSICTYTTDQVRAITQNNGSISIALSAQRIDLLATLYERTNRLNQVESLWLRAVESGFASWSDIGE